MARAALLVALAVLVAACGVSAATTRGRMGRSPGSPGQGPSPGTAARLEEYEQRYLRFHRKYVKRPESFKPSGPQDIRTEIATIDKETLRVAGLEAIPALAEAAYTFAAVLAAARAEAAADAGAGGVAYRAIQPAAFAKMTDAELSAEREANARFAELMLELRSDIDKYKAMRREATPLEYDLKDSDSPMYRGIFLHYVALGGDYRMQRLIAQMMLPLMGSAVDRVLWHLALASELPDYCLLEQAKQMFMYDLRLMQTTVCPLGDNPSCVDEAIGHIMNRMELVTEARMDELRRPEEFLAVFTRDDNDYAERCWMFSEDYRSLADRHRLATTLRSLKNHSGRVDGLAILDNFRLFESFSFSGDLTELFLAMRAVYFRLMTCRLLASKRVTAGHGPVADKDLEIEGHACHSMDVEMERLRFMIRLAVVFIDANGGHESVHFDAELLEVRMLAEFAGMRGDDWMSVVDRHRGELCMRLLVHGQAGHSQVDHQDVWMDEYAALADLSREITDMCERGIVDGCDVGVVALPEECRRVTAALVEEKPMAPLGDEFSARLKEMDGRRTSWQHFLLKRSFNLRGDVPAASGRSAVIPSVLTKVGAGRVPDQTFRPIDRCIVHDHLMQTQEEAARGRNANMFYKHKVLPEVGADAMVRTLAGLIRRKYQTHRLQDLKSFEHFIFDDVSNSNIYMNGLGTDRSGRRGRKTITNIGVSLEMFGDCREHANSMTAMFAYWQSRLMVQTLRHHMHLGLQAYDDAMGLTAYYGGDEQDDSVLEPAEVTVEEMDPDIRARYEAATDQDARKRLEFTARERAQEKAARRAYYDRMDQGGMLGTMAGHLKHDVRGVHAEFFVPGVVAEMYNVRHTPEGHGVLRRVEFAGGIPQLTEYEKDPWGRENFWVCPGEGGRKRVVVQPKANDRVFSADEQRGCVLYVLAEEHTFSILATNGEGARSPPALMWDGDEGVRFQFADSFYSHVHDDLRVRGEFSLGGYSGRMRRAMEWMDGFEGETGREKLGHERSPMALGYTGHNHIVPFCKDPAACGADEGYPVRSLFMANEEDFLDEESGVTVSMPIYWRPTDFSGKVFSQADNSFEDYQATEIGLEVEGFRPTFHPKGLQASREYQARLLFWYCGERAGTDEECFTAQTPDEDLKSLFNARE